MDNDQVALITEQMRHALDLMRAGIDALQTQQSHDRQMSDQRLAALERTAADQEQRLRAATEGVTQYKVWAGLAGGGSSILSVLAMLRAFIGG